VSAKPILNPNRPIRNRLNEVGWLLTSPTLLTYSTNHLQIRHTHISPLARCEAHSGISRTGWLAQDDFAYAGSIASNTSSSKGNRLIATLSKDSSLGPDTLWPFPHCS
jgi:hypothetical protein